MPIIIPANSAASGGFEVANSVRFNGGSNDHLKRTLGTATNVKKFTMSWWFKGTGIATGSMFEAASGNVQNGAFVYLKLDDILIDSIVGNSETMKLVPTAHYSDYAAWYHFCLAVDVTLGTAADRNKLYINGERVTSFVTQTNAGQNAARMFNTAIEHLIGIDVYNSGGWGVIDIDGVSGGELRFQRAGTTYLDIYANHSGSVSSVIKATDHLSIHVNNSTAADRTVFIENTGKVGIGTTSPAGRLHVDGATSAVAALTLEGNANGDQIPLHFKCKANNGTVTYHGIFANAGTANTDNTLCIGAGPTTGITIDNNGRVGIGQTDMGAYEGHLYIKASVTNLRHIIHNTSGSGLRWELNSASSGSFYIGNPTLNALTINSAGDVTFGGNINSTSSTLNGIVHAPVRATTTHPGSASSTVYNVYNKSRLSGKLNLPFHVYFPNATSNLAIRLYTTVNSLWFSGEVIIGSTYSNASATGINRYSFSHNMNAGTNYASALTQTETMGAVSSHFTFDSHGYDATEGAHYFEFRHITSTGNTMFVQFQGHGSAPAYSTSAWYIKHTTF